MPTDVNWRPRSATASLAVGWVAVLTPVVYLSVVGWDSDEHAGTVILIGVMATTFQLAVWGTGWMMTRRTAPAARRVAFGAGATISLVLSLVVLAVTVSPAWAMTTYVALAGVTVGIAALSPELRAGGSRGDRP